MSTKQRYGTAVWEAVVHFDKLWNDGHTAFRTAGEIAKFAGVSIPTARKYLDQLASEKHVIKIVLATNRAFYAYSEKSVES